MAKNRLFAVLGSLAAAHFGAVDAIALEEPPAPASPALWRVSDEDSELYLFGAFSFLPAGAAWRSRELAGALDASEMLWFEAPVGDPAAAARANDIFNSQGMLRSGGSLAALLGPDRKEALERAANSAGMTAEALDGLKPWAAFVILSSRIFASLGIDPADGVDAALMREAESRGRSLRYFDTIDQSLGLLTNMPETEQISLLAYLLDDWPRQQADAMRSFNAWRTGDAASTDAYLNETMRAAAPEAYESLISARVEALAGEIGEILKGRGTALVALSASYVVGQGSLPEALAARGFNVERVGAAPSEKLLRE